MDLSRISTLIIVISLIPGSAGFPCAPAPPNGRSVEVLQESAVIVWDAKTKTQHFIRSATFESDSPDFGFLVPTPDIPTLQESSERIFSLTEDWMAPETIEKEIHGVYPIIILAQFFLLRAPREGAMVQSTPPAVRILAKQRVSGYDAVVLEADNAKALQGWLNEHKYAARAELIEWLEPYIQKKWKISAFKIAHNAGGEAFATLPVKMSFSTDRPFFPYREPSNQRDEKESPDTRVLRIYLLSDSKMDAELGTSGSWPGKILWSDRLSERRRKTAAQELKIDLQALPSSLRMTTLEDLSSPRPGRDDLYFFRANDQTRLVPPPNVVEIDKRIPLPLDLLIFLGFVAMLIFRRRRKAKERLPV